jgi:hypothetical protein
MVCKFAQRNMTPDTLTPSSATRWKRKVHQHSCSITDSQTNALSTTSRRWVRCIYLKRLEESLPRTTCWITPPSASNGGWTYLFFPSIHYYRIETSRRFSLRIPWRIRSLELASIGMSSATVKTASLGTMIIQGLFTACQTVCHPKSLHSGVTLFLQELTWCTH